MASRKRRQRTRMFPVSAPSPIVNIAERRSRRESIQPERKSSMFIVVPSLTGRVHFTIPIQFGRAMASTHLAESPFRFQTHIEPGKRPADYVRNVIVQTFLRETDADWLMMWDDDEVIPDNFWQLCTVKDADVVSGLTPVWVANMDAEAMLRVNNYGLDPEHRCYNLPIPDESVKQPYRVPIVGTGCIAIRRRVFAPKPHGVGANPFYFTYSDDRKIQAGEDINFSVECNRAGFVLAVHPGVRFDHEKSLPLWQVEKYYHARKSMELSGKQTTDAQRLSIG